MDDPGAPPRGEVPLTAAGANGPKNIEFPSDVLGALDVVPDSGPEEVWDAFLASFGDLLVRTAAYAHRGSDASMDAYTFILEKLRQDDFRRLRAFSGGDREAFTRWLVVVARRLCSDLRRERYGRARPTTPEMDREARRRLVDEIWDPREPSELPAGQASNPEWELRHRERRMALESALEEIEPRDRLLLAFRFDDGLSARRISDLMDFPTPFHVYRHLNRVLALLRARLEERGIDGPAP